MDTRSQIFANSFEARLPTPWKTTGGFFLSQLFRVRSLSVRDPFSTAIKGGWIGFRSNYENVYIYIYGINAISWAKLRFRREEQFRTIVYCSKIESEKRLNWFSFRIGDFVWRMFEVIEYSLISLNCCWNLIKEIIFFIIIIIVFSFYIFHSMWKENTVFFSRNSILFPVFLNINNLIAFPFSNCRSI